MIYHVAALWNLHSIQTHGLAPGAGGKFGGHQERSKGKLFFTEAQGVPYWWSRIGDALEHQAESGDGGAVPVLLRTPFASMDDLYEDDSGTQDAGAEAGYMFEGMEPRLLELWDGQEWIDLEDADPDEMIEHALETADIEEVGSETFYWLNSDTYWPGEENIPSEEEYEEELEEYED